MRWWNAVPALTPVVAFDCLHMESQYVMSDLSGGAKHINTGNQPSGSKVRSTTDTNFAILGNGGNATHARVTTPTQGLLCAYLHDVNPRIMCFSDYGGPSGSNPHALLVERDAPAPYGQLRNAGTLGAVNMPDDAKVKFVALRFSATVWQFYYNGAWLGNEQAADFAATVLQSSVGSNWPNAWGWHAGVSCIGMFSGACTLADIQRMESTARAEFAGPPVGAFSPQINVNTSISNSLARNPGPPHSFSAPLKSSWRNAFFSGNGRITGTVQEAGTPKQALVRQVFLYNENTRLLVADTWSDAAGNYRFDHLDRAQRYTVIGYDYTHLYRAVIADNLQPGLMP